MRMLAVAAGVFGFAFVSACDSRPRQAKSPDPPLGDDGITHGAEVLFSKRVASATDCFLLGHDPPRPTCELGSRLVKTWGPAPAEPPPEPKCPIQVRLDEHGDVIAEPFSAFDRLPIEECVPPKYQIGQRRVLPADDGLLVAYAGAFDGDVFWQGPPVERGWSELPSHVRAPISSARLVGFARAPSGTILALGVGRARLGLGGVVALDRLGPGRFVPRLVATLPVRPSPVVFDDHGRLVTFAEGFIVRVDEDGRVENLHYVARDVGRISSIARDGDGVIYLGLECGVLRLVPRPAPSRDFHEEWWSARDGASGHWEACL